MTTAGYRLLEDMDNVDDNEAGAATDTSDVTVSPRQASCNPQVETKTPGFIYFLTFLSAIGGFLFGYDTGVIAGAIVLLQLEFSLSSVWREAIVSIPMASAALFSLISDLTNSRLGRKITILTASAVFTVGAILLAVSQNVYMLLAGRFVIGIGIGLASSTVPMYIAECAPSQLRGRLVTLNNVFITGGQFIASVISGAFSYDIHSGWRYMFGLAAIPPFLQFIGFMYMPESPRWLCDKKQHDKARSVLRQIRGADDVERELCDIKESCYRDEENGSGCVLGRMLSTVSVRRALFIGCMLQLFQQIVGINTVMYYSATIIKMSGVGSTSSAIWLSSITAAVNCLFTFVGFYVVDRVGRRHLTIVSLVGVMVSLVFLGVGFQMVAKNSPDIEVVESGTSPFDTHHACGNYTNCNNCMMDSACGFCYVGSSNSLASNGSCLPVAHSGSSGEIVEFDRSAFGRCSNESRRAVDGDEWAYDYCPTGYSWMTIVGLVLYLAFFAPGMGPMPWTINAEIYPLWARSTGNSIATCVNWIANLVISMTFLTLTESITRYGAFYLYAVFALVGVIIFVVFLPETKGKPLEDIERLFSEPSTFCRRRTSYERFAQ